VACSLSLRGPALVIGTVPVDAPLPAAAIGNTTLRSDLVLCRRARRGLCMGAITGPRCWRASKLWEVVVDIADGHLQR
jgi:hypothetical protein